MKPFKFFQKDNGSFFSRLSEMVQPNNNWIQDRVTDNAREYYRNQFEGNFNPNGAHNDIDREVIHMVEEYFNFQPVTYKETETLWIEIMSHDIDNSSPFSDFCHTLNVDVHLRNSPHGRVRYIIAKNDGGFIQIREKRIEADERF
jgi:hypothetical protein